MIKFIHPDVKYFPNEKLIIDITYLNQTQLVNEIFTTKIVDFNNEVNNKLNIPLIKVREYDYDSDGLIDEFMFKISIPFKTQNPANIKNIKILFFFNYQFNDYHIKWKSEDSICEINIDTPYGLSYLKTIGEIKLKQSEPFPSNNYISYKSVNYDEIISKYYQRTIYTYYEYEKIAMPRRSGDFVVIESHIKVPSYQEVIFETPSFSGLKLSWIQYFAIFIPLYVIAKLLLMGLLKNDLVFSKKNNDLPRFVKSK